MRWKNKCASSEVLESMGEALNIQDRINTYECHTIIVEDARMVMKRS